MSDTKKKKPAEVEAAEVTTPAADPAAEAAKIIAEAEAKAAAIVAAAEAKAAEAVEAEDEHAPEVDPMEELVDYTAPLLPHLKKRDILVGVNGELLRIQRGVPVKIKRKYYEAIQNAAAQEFAAMEARQDIQRQGAKAMAAM